MPTLGTQTIQTSYPQLLKTDGLGGIDGTLQAITDGDNTASALELSTVGVRSTGTLNVAGATTLASSLAVTGAVTLSSSLGVTGVATFSSSISATTGTATIGTLSASTATISTATISTATISTATISTSTISSATIPRINGVTTFATGFTSSTGTNTIGTIESTTINNTGLATTGSLQVGASGPKLTAVSFGTAAFTSATVAAHNGADATTGSFGLTGVALGDIIIGSLNSLGSATGTVNIGLSLYPSATNFVEYSIQNQGATAGTIPAGIFSVAALRFTA